ncbi:MAG: hypothetical protein Q8M92_00300, partial [Candidatus Subteraquimicrobiales bacterium]|nr:hypothetical protein [Candidatus Subteraquimicrobiales bacterium]
LRDIQEALTRFTKGGTENRISSVNQDAEVNKSYIERVRAAIASVRGKYLDAKAFADIVITTVEPSDINRMRVNVGIKFVCYRQNREIYVTAYIE